MPKFPECPDNRSDCVFTPHGPRCVTLAHYPPRYDCDGRNLNPDRNAVSEEFACEKCGRTWEGSRMVFQSEEETRWTERTART